MKDISYKMRRVGRGFSLAEVVASVTIGAMVLVAMLGIYRRAETSSAAIKRKLDSFRLPSEVLQRIAEDLDRIITTDSDTRIIVENKIIKGYPAARLTIQKTITGDKNRARQFETIVWQSSYDYENDANGLVLYRSHSGMALEDKLLDEKRADWEKAYPFVPICDGVTFFSIQVPKGEDFLNKWPGRTLPRGIVATISFAEPFETLEGTLDVPYEEKNTRTIAVDRTRKIKFIFVAAGQDDEEYSEEEEGEEAEEEEEDKEDEPEGIEDKEEATKDIEEGIKDGDKRSDRERKSGQR